jgi:hypothetical protein
MCAAYENCLSEIFYYFYILFLKFTKLILKYKNTKKSVTGVTDDEGSETQEMLLGLNDDPYSYDDVTNNL